MPFNLYQNLVLSKNDFGNFSYRTLPGFSDELGRYLVRIRIIRNDRWKKICFQITAHASMTARELIQSHWSNSIQWWQICMRLPLIENKLLEVDPIWCKIILIIPTDIALGPHFCDCDPNYYCPLSYFNSIAALQEHVVALIARNLISEIARMVRRFMIYFIHTLCAEFVINERNWYDYFLYHNFTKGMKSIPNSTYVIQNGIHFPQRILQFSHTKSELGAFSWILNMEQDKKPAGFRVRD